MIRRKLAWRCHCLLRRNCARAFRLVLWSVPAESIHRAKYLVRTWPVDCPLVVLSSKLVFIRRLATGYWLLWITTTLVRWSSTKTFLMPPDCEQAEGVSGPCSLSLYYVCSPYFSSVVGSLSLSLSLSISLNHFIEIPNTEETKTRTKIRNNTRKIYI